MVKREPAVVLRTHVLGEADLIVTLLSRTSGKLRAAAKGARGSKKRYPGGIDLLDCGIFEVAPARTSTQLPRIQSLEQKQFWPMLRTDLKRYTAASYLIELTDALTVEGDADTGALFDPLFLSIQSVHKSTDETSYAAILSYYTIAILDLCGFGLSDDEGRLAPDVAAWFSEMLRIRSPVIPFRQGIAAEGLLSLIRHVQAVLSRSLRTAEPLLSALRNRTPEV